MAKIYIDEPAHPDNKIQLKNDERFTKPNFKPKLDRFEPFSKRMSFLLPIFYFFLPENSI
ncbi:hypothetical protein [Methanococcoides seepicolus]|uniref:Uncharacterized protein n=1 Tax=Methanococcoides seepicolus TaxID=2828780 RepID=A0A9E4ZFQ7_9EURY|nr:hypothetical protein [Methanococcoides seepicolus]MCM1987060.1 hypothetical protein [Methanococcoides seepicolus]